MDTKLINLQVSASVGEKLQTLAQEKHTDPVSIITQLVTEAYQRRHWLQDLAILSEQIQAQNGSQLKKTKEEIIADLHNTRQEIFEAEYAHLYR